MTATFGPTSTAPHLLPHLTITPSEPIGRRVEDDPLVSDDVLDGLACTRCGVDFELGEMSVPSGWSDGCELWRHSACT